MTKNLLIIPFCLFFLQASAQRNRQVSVAITSNSTAMPFSKLGGLFKTPVHPGVEFGYGINWKTRRKHDWFQTFKAGYFYHRFVQHAIPVYTTFGYRYKFLEALDAETSFGAGYMHSVPATAKYRLNSSGEYENNKGIGRMQAIAVFNIGGNYNINRKAKRPKSIFALYQQQLQMPFIKSYVPLLPYNTFVLGVKVNYLKQDMQNSLPSTSF